MLEKIRATINQFLTRRHEDTKAKLPGKICHQKTKKVYLFAPPSWSDGYAYVSGAGGLWFRQRVANVSPPLQHLFERSCVASKHNQVKLIVCQIHPEKKKTKNKHNYQF